MTKFPNTQRMANDKYQSDCPKLFLMYLALAYLFHLILIVGFATHTDTDTGNHLIFNKYGTGYFVFLLLLTLPLPFLPTFLKFLLRDSQYRLSNGHVVLLKPFKKFVFLCLILAFLAVISESLLQIKTSMEIRTRPPDYLLGFHPFLQIVPSPLTYDGINKDGFRGSEIEIKKRPDTFRIFCLGGSTTFNPFLKFEDTYPRKLEKELHAHISSQPSSKSRTIEVQNAGMSWYTSQHSLINLQIRILDFQPDMIVVCHAINDLCRSFTPPKHALNGRGFRNDYSHYLGPQASMFLDLSRQRSPTLADSVIILRGSIKFFSSRFLSDFRYRTSKMVESEMTAFLSLASFVRNLRLLSEIAVLRKIPLVFLTQPYLYKSQMNPEELAALTFPREHLNDGLRMASVKSMVRGMRLFNGATRSLAKAKNLVLVDLEKTFPQTLEYFTDDVHYTPKGAALVAKSVAKTLIENQLK